MFTRTSSVFTWRDKTVFNVSPILEKISPIWNQLSSDFDHAPSIFDNVSFTEIPHSYECSPARPVSSPGETKERLTSPLFSINSALSPITPPLSDIRRDLVRPVSSPEETKQRSTSTQGLLASLSTYLVDLTSIADSDNLRSGVKRSRL